MRSVQSIAARAVRIARSRPTWLYRSAFVRDDGAARIAARGIYILPTGTGLLYGAVALTMLVGSLNYRSNLSLWITFLMISVALVAMHHCWFDLLGLEVRARPGPPVFAGNPARFELILSNPRSAPKYDLRVVDGMVPVRLERLEGGESGTLTISVPTVTRGLATLPRVQIQTRHPMHLFRGWCYASSTATVLVFPAPAAVAPPPEPIPGDGRLPGPSHGDGADDFVGAREYRVGDSPRRLDWKAAARERGLVVKQFADDQGLEIWIDWDVLLGAGDRERRIALLARQVLDAGAMQARFGLRLPGSTVPPDSGEGQVRRCLTELALMDHEEETRRRIRIAP
jgi:uncharacterized protein (DUF58 family)